MKMDKKNSETKWNVDLGIILLITGALANITVWIGAFVATEANGPVGTWVRQWLLPILGGISGLAIGITVAFGLVYVIAKLNKMQPTISRKERGKKRYKTMPNVRFYGAWAAIILLLIISPALLAPYVYMTISGTETLFLVLGSWAGAWSVARILAADLALGAVAMVQGVHLGAVAADGRAAHTAKSATGAPESKPQTVRTAKSAKASATTAAEVAKETRVCDVQGCGISYVWPQGKGAHFRKYHKDLIIQKGIPVQMVKRAEVQKVDEK